MDVPAPLAANALIEAVGAGGVLFFSDDPVVALTAPRAEVLRAATEAEVRVVLATPATSRLSEPMRAALQDARASWVVEGPDGERWDGVTGRTLDRGADATLPVPEGAAVSPRFAAGAPAEAVQLVLAASVRHRPDDPPVAARLLGHLLDALGRPAPALAGFDEPLTEPWDPAGFARLAARQRALPQMLLGSADDDALAASVLLRPTRVGFEEVLEASLAVGPAGEQAEATVASVAEVVRTAFERTARAELPLFALALVRPGRADLQVPPLLPFAPAPLAVLIGPAGVRDLGLDPVALHDRFGAQTVGRARIPALFVPFGGRLDGWRAVGRFVEAVGAERVAAAFGRPLPGFG